MSIESLILVSYTLAGLVHVDFQQQLSNKISYESLSKFIMDLDLFLDILTTIVLTQMVGQNTRAIF